MAVAEGIRRFLSSGCRISFLIVCFIITGCPRIGNVDLGGCVSTVVCTADADCNDEDVCTTDTCGDDGCCVFAPLCAADDDCNDRDACTTDVCGDDGCCVFTPMCAADADCNDGDVCTTDACVAGCCEFTPLCTADADCDDGDVCTTDVCVASCCLFTPACSADADCNDGDVCTTDACVADCCVFTPLCTADTDCSDGEACTADACVESCCVSIPLCAADANCNDGDDCTTDACVAGCCMHTPLCPGRVLRTMCPSLNDQEISTLVAGLTARFEDGASLAEAYAGVGGLCSEQTASTATAVDCALCHVAAVLELWPPNGQLETLCPTLTDEQIAAHVAALTASFDSGDSLAEIRIAVGIGCSALATKEVGVTCALCEGAAVVQIWGE